MTDVAGARAADSALLERLCAASATEPGPRTLIVVAHPDDEVIGAAGRLPFLRGAHVVHVTDGAPHDMHDAMAAGFYTREAYAAARRAEALAALARARVEAERVHCLGRVDQEAALDLPALALVIASVIAGLEPELVLTHPYEGGHPDHDATAFATHAALRILERDGAPRPALLELSSYHAGPTGITPACFLPWAGHEPRVIPLDDGARSLKRRMMACFATQRATLRWFPVEVECFRLAPPYDFTRPPHAGKLWYEFFPLGMTAARWIELAAAALRTLGLGAHAGTEAATSCLPS